MQSTTKLKEFERLEENRKTEEIAALWNSYDYSKVKLSDIWTGRWLNKTYSMKKIEEDIKNSIDTIESGLKTIDSLIKDVNVAETIKAKYLIRLDLNCVIAEYEAEQQARELIKKPKEEPKIDDETEEIVKEEVPTNDEKMYVFRFEVIGTKQELDRLAAYLKNKRLRYKSFRLRREK